MDGTMAPFATILGSRDFTVPETELMMQADINPPGSPIFCPTNTWSPFATSGLAGAPICWDSGKTISPFGCSTDTGLLIDSSLPSYGWMPPLNVAKPI